MLNALRTGTKSIFLKIILFGILLMALAGLALTDVQGFFSGGSVGRGHVAEVAGQKISTMEFSNRVQVAMRNAGMDSVSAARSGLPRQILEEEINARLYAQAAHDAGLRISDAAVAVQLKELIKPLLSAGMGEDLALQRVLQSQGMSEAMLVRTMKKDMATENLLKAVLYGTAAPEQMVQDALKYRNEERKGYYFKITSADIPDIEKPSDEVLKKYYDTVAEQYALPEYRTFSIAVLNAKTIASEISVSDDEIQMFYEERISDFREPEERMVSHIIFEDEQTAKDVLNAVNEDGVSLKDAAADIAADAHTVVAAESYTRNTIPVELMDTAFSAQPDTPAGPVKSPFGWHIVVVENIVPQKTKPLSEVKEMLATEIRENKTYETLYEVSNDVDDLLAGGSTLDEASREIGFGILKAPPVDMAGQMPSGERLKLDVPELAKVLESGFDLNEGDVSPMIETTDGAFVVVEATEVQPSRIRDLEEVRAEVTQSWLAEQKEIAFNKKADDILADIQSGKDFTEVARAEGKTTTKTDTLQRSSDAGKMPTNGFIPTLFGLGGKTEAATLPVENGLLVVGLAEQSFPDTDTPAEEVEALRNLLGQSMQRDILEQFRNGLGDEYKVEINERALNDLYAQLTEDVY